MRRLLPCCLLWIALLLWPASVRAEPSSLETYRQRLTEAYAAAQRSDRIGLDEIAVALTATSSVVLPDQTSVAVDNRWLQAALSEEPPNFPLITARLGALLDALGQARTPPSPDALQKLDQVFEVPPFKDREVPSAWTSFWRNVGRAIEDFFDWLFRTPPNLNPPSIPTPREPNVGFSQLGGVGRCLLVLGVLLVLALVVYAVRSVRGSIVRDAKAKKEQAADDDEPLTATDALAQAETTAKAGDYRTAVRFLYLSSLLWLHEQRMLRYDRSLTNREYLQQLEGKPLRAQLSPIVETFDNVWYGKQPLDPTDFAAYEAQIAALRQRQEPNR